MCPPTSGALDSAGGAGDCAGDCGGGGDPCWATIPVSRYGNPHLFTGQRYDAGVGLHHFFARSYDAHLGRWLQRDPLGYVDGASLYQYVQSNATGATAPLGLYWDLDAAGWDYVQRQEQEYRRRLSDFLNDDYAFAVWQGDITAGRGAQVVDDSLAAGEALRHLPMTIANGTILAPVHDVLGRYATLRDGGAGAVEAGLLAAGWMAGDATGLGGMYDAVAGEDAYGNGLTTSERVVRGAAGLVQFGATAAGVYGVSRCAVEGGAASAAKSEAIAAQRPSLWTRAEFDGRRVYQRNDLINPRSLDGLGRTNVQRMEQGLAPLGPDGRPVNLHHMLQTAESPLVELSQTFHQQHSRIIHINPSTTPTGIDRAAFDGWRRSYWAHRAGDFVS